MNYSPPSDKTLALLNVLYWPGFGIAKIRELSQLLPTTYELEDLREISATHFTKLATPSYTEVKNVSIRVDQLVQACEQQGIVILSLLDENYPDRLRQVPDAPPLLFVKGNLSTLGMRSAAVVGTREASDAGLKIATEIASTLVEYKYCVTSGLAMGIDTAAHRGALRARGNTIAVLAHGLHMISPASNKGLADQILASDGALVAEHVPGTPPRRSEFVRRNRIQSGLSVFSIIVESGEHGGAIHQARFTKKQGRDLLVILPQEDTLKSFNRSGARYLISHEGARPLQDRQALLEYLKSLDLARSPESGEHSAADHSLEKGSEDSGGDGKGQLELRW